MGDIQEISSDAVIAALRSFPSDGKSPMDNDTYVVWLHMEAIGLIESVTEDKPCSTCGQARSGMSYHKITRAGRFVRDMAS